MSDKIDYLEPGDGRDSAIELMVEKSSGDIDKLVVEYGESEWSLITSVRNVVMDRTSLCHAMDLGVGVLVRTTEMRGSGGIAVDMVYVPGVWIVPDKKDSSLSKIVSK